MTEAEINRIRRRMGRPLPGMEAQSKMMPMTRKTIYKDLVVPEDAKRSAVMILLYPGRDGLHFPLIERAEYPGVHSKQIGFPGGSWEEGDEDFVATALRETEEEVGVSRSSIHVLGLLSPLYIPPSNFWVQPVLGFLPEEPHWQIDPIEVASLLHPRLSGIVAGEFESESRIQHSSGAKMIVPSYVIEGHVVWGATAMMLSELAEMLNTLGQD